MVHAEWLLSLPVNGYCLYPLLHKKVWKIIGNTAEIRYICTGKYMIMKKLYLLLYCLIAACTLTAGNTLGERKEYAEAAQTAENEMVQIADSTFKDVAIIQKANDAIVAVSQMNNIRKSLLYCSLTIILLYLLWLGYHFTASRLSRKQKHLAHYRHRGLRIMAVLTLVSGCVLYYIGFFTSGTASSLPAYFVRPLIASIGMFVGNTAYQEVSEECTGSAFYMTCFAIVHLSAILISATFVISFFWKRVKSWFWCQCWNIEGFFCRITRQRLFKGKTLNVFFGFNEPTLLLAKSITGKREYRKANHLVFVDMPQNDIVSPEPASLSQIFGIFPYKREYVNQLSDIRYVLQNANHHPATEDNADDKLLDKLGLHGLRQLMKNHHKVRAYFLSDNEDDNIKSVVNFLADDICTVGKSIDIYCHARKTDSNGAIEKMAYVKGGTVHPNIHIIDSSELAVNQLKNHVEYQPVSFVSPDTAQATVSNPFISLIVGFGETGRDMLRFLYEFSAFPNSKGDKCPVRCYAIDSRMDTLRGDFYHNMPALKGNNEVELLQYSTKDPQFWTWTNTILPQLNYVCIALGNDDENIQLAIDLFETACRIDGKDMEHFKIFIRSHQQGNESKLRQIASFYNEKSGICDRNGKKLEHIVVFGNQQDTYTYEHIVAEDTIQEAMQYYSKYNLSASKEENRKTWDARHEINTDKTAITIAQINALIRRESQDIANSQHARTKLKLIGLTMEEAKALYAPAAQLSNEQQEKKALLDFINSFNSEEKPEYVKDEQLLQQMPMQQVIRNMAVCEHLRWVASHEMLGYVCGDEDNEVKKTHTCLRPWHELSPEIQDYDYNVMEKTVELLINKSS